MKKIVSVTILTLLLIGMWTLAFNIQPVKSQLEKLASGDEVWTLAVDSDYVYFTELTAGRISKVPKGEGAVSTLATGISRVTEIVCDSEYVYYADEFDGVVTRIGKNGENPTVLADGLTSVFFITQDIDYIYFAEGMHRFSSGSVKKVSKAGGPITTLVTGITETGGLVADLDHVYFVSDRYSASRISRVNKDGTNLITLVSGLGTCVDNLAADNEYVYFAEYTPYQQSVSRVGRVPKAGGSAQILADGQNNLWGIDVDSDFVYFSESGAGNVKKVPKNGGTIETLVGGYPGTGQLIVESNNVYYCVANWGQPHPLNGVYKLRLVTPAVVDIDPDTLNLKSKGRWITAYIELPEGYDVAGIDVSSIFLNETIPVDPSAPIAVGDCDHDTIPDLMVKFDRAKVISYILGNIDIEERFTTVTLTITGKLYDGTSFQGSGTITIILPMPRHWRFLEFY